MMVEKYMLTGILCTWTRIRISERKRGFEKRIQIHINKKKLKILGFYQAAIRKITPEEFQ